MNISSSTNGTEGSEGAVEYAVGLTIQHMTVGAAFDNGALVGVEVAEFGSVAPMSYPVKDDEGATSCSPEGCIFEGMDGVSKGEGSRRPAILIVGLVSCGGHVVE